MIAAGTGVTYATSPMGADHTAGNALPNTRLPNGTTPDTTSKEAQVALSSYLQQLAMILDTLGLCWFTRPPLLENFSLVTDLIEAMYGIDVSLEELFEMARETLHCEYLFNQRAGLRGKNDLPAYFRNESLDPLGHVFDVDQEELNQLEWMGE